MISIALLIAAAAAAPAERVTFASSPLNDYNLSFDARERLVVFARSEADFQKARIFVAKRTRTGWSVPAPISFFDERYSDSDPWLTPDGRTLYFISDRAASGREAKRTDYDIWRATRTGQGWSPPERLGPEVNGAGQELGPELHQGRLYFSSPRRSGVGGLDIYQARQNGSGFETATRLDGPFNSSASESDFTLSPDGKAAMFWRSLEGRGMIHIAYADGGGWSQPVPLPAGINSGPFNFTPSFSGDGRRVRYASTIEREGQPSGLADIYEAELPARRSVARELNVTRRKGT
jgi:Tol biopolymer transport system component